MKIGAKKERNEKEKVNRRPPRMRLVHLCFFLVGGNNPRNVSDLVQLTFFSVLRLHFVHKEEGQFSPALSSVPNLGGNPLSLQK